MNKNQPKSLPAMHTCYHEAGHYMVARLFPTKLRIMELTVNKLSLPDKWNGGVSIKGKVKNYSPEVADCHLLTFCGGMAATTIFTYGVDYVYQNIRSFPRQRDLMDAEGAMDDYEMIKSIAGDLSSSNNLEKSRIIWNAIQTVLLYLMEPEVWDAVILIANTVKEHRNLRLSRYEIEWLLWRKLGWRKLKECRKKFVANRYPLSRTKISRLL